MKIRVADVMSGPPVSVTPGTGFGEVARVLREHAIDAVPVVEDGKVVGVVSASDLLPKEERVLIESRPHLLEGPAARRARARASATTAAELMTKPAVTAMPGTTVADAARRMDQHAVHNLPVVDGRGTLVGLVSRTDLLRVFARSDDDLRREILEDVVAAALLLDPGALRVDVEDGIVRLAGVAPQLSDVELLTDLVLRVDGVVDVVNDVVGETGDPTRGPATGSTGLPFTW